jgi:hypothetical protein
VLQRTFIYEGSRIIAKEEGGRGVVITKYSYYQTFKASVENTLKNKSNVKY